MIVCIVDVVQSRAWQIILFGAMILALASCQDALISPFENRERFFTVFGHIEQGKTTHTLRVTPLMKFPEVIESPDDPHATLDATVTTTDVGSGATRQWVHKLERLSDGTYAHIFQATQMTILPGHTYRLEVRRSDGTTATAETTVPDFSTFPPPVRNAPQSNGTEITQDIHIPQLASPWDIRVIYHFPVGPRLIPIPVAYGRPGERTADGGWRFTINLSEDARIVRQILETEFPDQVFILQQMSLLVRVLDDQWDPPEGVFDPEVLAQPSVLSNIENGYGFFGSVGVYFPEWPISRDFSQALGFQ